MDVFKSIGNIFTGGGQAQTTPTTFPGGTIPGVSTAPSPLWQQLLLGGMFGAGELGNLLQSHKQNQYQDTLLNLARNPDQLTALINKSTQPLSNALVQSINNRVQGDMASRGLAQAPGIFAASEAQALAPFQIQNQEMAQQQVLAALGLPGSYTNINQPPQSMAPALSQFLRSLGPRPSPGIVPQQTSSPADFSGFTFDPGTTAPSYPVATDPFEGSV
jgi:hypothetical protein